MESTGINRIEQPNLINLYLNEDHPLCREERQFALLLYNKLKSNNPVIMDYLNLEGEIVDAFFEATLMRDYWHSDKVKFNELLKDYIEINFCKNNDVCELGKNKKIHIKKWKKSHPYGNWMMHAKPDIGIINLVDDKYFLHFIECKYLSIESVYKCEVDNNGNQIKTQEDILDFLCNYLNLKYEDSEGKNNDIQKGEVIKVNFNILESSKIQDSSGYYKIKIKDIF